MKKIFAATIVVTLLANMLGCKDETADVATLVDVTAPGIILNGEDLVILPTGSPFTDEGAIGIDSLSGNRQTNLAAETLPNVNVPGLYPLNYTAYDANGFTSAVTRNVFVFDNTLTAGYTLVTSQDLSGTYAHTSNGRVVNVVQVLP